MEGPSQTGRRKRALTREAVGSGLKEAVRDMGLAEDVVRDEAAEKGVVQGGRNPLEGESRPINLPRHKDGLCASLG
jgi:hypothetical protein